MKKLLLTAFVLFIAVLGFSQLPFYVPANGLVGFWPFTTDSFDVGPNGYTATINVTNPNQFTGTGMEVDPNFAFLSVVTDTLLAFNGDFSASVHFNGNGHVQSNQVALISQFVLTGANFEGWVIHIDTTGPSTGVLSASVATMGVHVLQGTTSINPTGAHNVTLTLKGDTLTMYLDGHIEAQSGGFSMFGAYTSSLGFADGNNDPTGQHIYNGIIWNAGVWNRALTPCEVLNLATESIYPGAVITGPSSVNAGDTITLYCSPSAMGFPLNWYDVASEHTAYTAGQGTDSIKIAYPAGSVGWDSVYVQEILANGCTLTSAPFYINILNPSGIKTEPDSPELNFYPNPVSDKLNFKWNIPHEGDGYIYDVNGQIIKRFNANSNAVNVLDIHELAPGMYFVRVVDKTDNSGRSFHFAKL